MKHNSLTRLSFILAFILVTALVAGGCANRGTNDGMSTTSSTTTTTTTSASPGTVTSTDGTMGNTTSGGVATTASPGVSYDVRAASPAPFVSSDTMASPSPAQATSNTSLNTGNSASGGTAGTRTDANGMTASGSGTLNQGGTTSGSNSTVGSTSGSNTAVGSTSNNSNLDTTPTSSNNTFGSNSGTNSNKTLGSMSTGSSSNNTLGSASSGSEWSRSIFSSTNDSTASTSNGKMTDAQFTRTASMANSAELTLANLAMQKSSSAAVKQYAQHILTDHKAAGQKLESIATREGQPVSKDMDAQDKQTYSQLSGLQGAAFDRAFVTAMIQDHQKAINVFEQASRELPSGALKSFASETLPKLQQHLGHAQQLDQQISTAGD